MRAAQLLLLVLPTAASFLLAPQFGINYASNKRQLSGSKNLMLGSCNDETVISARELEFHPEVLRLRGGKKGTAAQGKRGTGHKAHPSYKYNLRYAISSFERILEYSCPWPAATHGRAELTGQTGSGIQSRKTDRYGRVFQRVCRINQTITIACQGTGRMRHMREVFQRFKNGFRCSPPYQGPAVTTSSIPAAPS